MTTKAASPTDPRSFLLSTRKVAEANSVSVRTIERWTDVGILPPPVRINGRKFWPADTTPKRDAADAA
jgi:predicted site-specific integrase-resolvase